MEKWLGCALDYIPRWIEFQAPMLRQPGCIVMIAHRDKVMLEQARSEERRVGKEC